MRTPTVLGARFLPVPTDARTVVGGVVSLLVLLVIVTRWTGPEARLQRALQRLPPAVEAVIVDRGPGSLGPVLTTVLALPPRPVPDRLPVALDLVLVVGGREQRVALLEPSVARAAGLSGPLVRGLTAIGPAEAVRVLQSAAASPTAGISAALRRLTTSEGAPALRFSLRRSFLARRLGSTLVPEGGLAAAVESADQRVVAQGVIDGSGPPRGLSGGTVLEQAIPGALVVLDGLPLTDLLPRELPSILEAVKTETGVADAIDAARNAAGDAPFVLVVLPADAGRADLVLGVTVPAGRAPAVVTALRAVLAGRLQRVGAVAERVRANGRVILHRRSGTSSGGGRDGSATALIEFDREGWHVLRAPQAAGSADLVVASRGDAVLIGSAETAVLQVATAVRGAPQPRMAKVEINLADARTLPVFSLLQRGAAPAVREWLAAVDRASLAMDGSRGEVRFTLDVTTSHPLAEFLTGGATPTPIR